MFVIAGLMKQKKKPKKVTVVVTLRFKAKDRNQRDVS